MWVVDLPLGATEDRVVGSIDVEKAIKEGIKALEPGILAAANRSLLYKYVSIIYILEFLLI